MRDVCKQTMESARLIHIPTSARKLYTRAMSGRSQAAAIRSFCLECVGYDRDEVTHCPDPGCPLYLYRMTGRKVRLPGKQSDQQKVDPPRSSNTSSAKRPNKPDLRLPQANSQISKKADLSQVQL